MAMAAWDVGLLHPIRRTSDLIERWCGMLCHRFLFFVLVISEPKANGNRNPNRIKDRVTTADYDYHFADYEYDYERQAQKHAYLRISTRFRL